MSSEIPGSTSEMQRAIERAAADYDWEAVRDLTTRALETGQLSPAEEYDLLDTRADANDNLTAMSAAAADMRRMLDLAQTIDDKPRIARAHNLLAISGLLSMNADQAYLNAAAAREIAVSLNLPQIEARALITLGWVAFSLDDFETAERHERKAILLARSGASPVDEATALRMLVRLPSIRNDSQMVDDYLDRSLRLARAGGDRHGELESLSIIAGFSLDMAKKQSYRRQALNIANLIGNRGLLSLQNNNLAWSHYWHFGLYQRAHAHALKAVYHQRQSGFLIALMTSLDTLGFIALSIGDFELARSSFAEIVEKAMPGDDYTNGIAGLGQLALAEGHFTEAVTYLEEAVSGYSDADLEVAAYTLGWLTAAFLAQKQLQGALDASERGLAIITNDDFSRTSYPPQDLWWWRYRTLSAAAGTPLAQDPWPALDAARSVLFKPIANIGDEGLRRNYLNKPPINRAIGETWAVEAAERGLSLAPFTERQTTPAALTEQLERIVDSGARLAAERDSEKLAAFIVQEFVELSGVERAILAIRAGGNRDAPWQWAASEGFDDGEQQLVAAFSDSFIKQVTLNKAPQLVDSTGEIPPDALPELHLRSVLALPLISQGKLWGVLYGDMRHLFGRLNENDRDILSLLANQAGAALENANWVDTLEQQVADRTAEAESARADAEAAKEEAEHANQTKSAFMSNMSHELRTPLNAIIGFTRIVQRKTKYQIPQKQTENLDKVLSSGEHLLGLINTVLDIAKIEAGRMDVVTSTFPIASLIESCTSLTQPLLKQNVQLISEINPDLPLIRSDQDKLKQILINLLSNAAKFTHKGSITISARAGAVKVTETTRDGVVHNAPLLEISVSDTGIGLNAQALEHIFEEFQQADNSTRREYGGTGLGLPISKHLAQLLGGDLTATSQEQIGSTFRVTVPFERE